MNTMQAFARGKANRRKQPKVFDWTKAAKLIKKHQPDCAVAGLASDMEYTAGTIYSNGQIVDDRYTYLSSTWATPVLEMDGEQHPCYVMQNDTKWNHSTKWPDEARAILEQQPPA